jgi:ABC-2 type transport system ATP-binding protein
VFVIRAEGLAKSYGKARGIVDVTFEVARGEVFGFLGPNGAGKTTTMRTLLGFIRPTGGSASIFDHDVRGDGIEIRRRTGYLPGDVALYGRMTPAQLFSYFAALRGGVERDHLARLVRRFDLDTSRRIEALSHGNRQKVAVIQAFMHRPELLVLDEPTQGLDPLVQQEFFALVAETRSAGGTILLSSHVMSEVERMCDRVAIIREGVVIEVQTIDDLIARGIRRLELRFEGPAPEASLRAIEGIRDLVVAGTAARCTVVGPIDPVLKELARHRVIELVSEKPSLEEVFLTFYGADDDTRTRRVERA